jgi:hypothetical protein
MGASPYGTDFHFWILWQQEYLSIIDNVVVNEYKISSTVSVDSSNFGSKNSLFWKDTFLEIFPSISANMMLCGWFKHLCLMSKLTKVHWSKQTICVILKHYNINYFSRI